MRLEHRRGRRLSRKTLYRLPDGQGFYNRRLILSPPPGWITVVKFTNIKDDYHGEEGRVVGPTASGSRLWIVVRYDNPEEIKVVTRALKNIIISEFIPGLYD